MKFMLQLHKPRKCPERKCWQEWMDALEKIEQSDPGLLVMLSERNEQRRRRRTRKSKFKFCSLKQVLLFKEIEKVMDISKNISNKFNIRCQKIKLRFKVSKLRLEKNLKTRDKS